MQPSSKLWGVTSDERLLNYPCDGYMETFHDTYYRGVTIHAHTEIVFRWICQMKVAPYSYDWIDNLGRKSPQKLIPGVDELKIGQKIMFIFDLIDFERNKHLTIRLNKAAIKFFGDSVISLKTEHNLIYILGLDHRFGQNSNPRHERKRPERLFSLTVVALSGRNDDQGHILYISERR